MFCVKKYSDNRFIIGKVFQTMVHTVHITTNSLPKIFYKSYLGEVAEDNAKLDTAKGVEG